MSSVQSGAAAEATLEVRKTPVGHSRGSGRQGCRRLGLGAGIRLPTQLPSRRLGSAGWRLTATTRFTDILARDISAIEIGLGRDGCKFPVYTISIDTRRRPLTQGPLLQLTGTYEVTHHPLGTSSRHVWRDACKADYPHIKEELVDGCVSCEEALF